MKINPMAASQSLASAPFVRVLSNANIFNGVRIRTVVFIHIDDSWEGDTRAYISHNDYENGLSFNSVSISLNRKEEYKLYKNINNKYCMITCKSNHDKLLDVPYFTDVENIEVYSDPKKRKNRI